MENETARQSCNEKKNKSLNRSSHVPLPIVGVRLLSSLRIKKIVFMSIWKLAENNIVKPDIVREKKTEKQYCNISRSKPDSKIKEDYRSMKNSLPLQCPRPSGLVVFCAYFGLCIIVE